MRLAELEIPARAEFVSVARLVVSSIAGDRYELSEDQLDNLKLAVSEACVIAIQSNGAKSDARVAIACEGSPDRLDVVVDGHGNDFTQDRAEPSMTDVEGRAVESALGIPLIGSLVDAVAVEERAPGNQLRMTLFCELAEEL